MTGGVFTFCGLFRTLNKCVVTLPQHERPFSEALPRRTMPRIRAVAKTTVKEHKEEPDGLTRPANFLHLIQYTSISNNMLEAH